MGTITFFKFIFTLTFFLKNSNDFCHSYAGFILATSHGMLLRHQNAIFEKKIQIKAWKTKNVKKSAKIWNKRFWKTITNSTTNYKLYLRLQIMILPEWQFRSDSWHENLCLKKCTGAHRPFNAFFELLGCSKSFYTSLFFNWKKCKVKCKNFWNNPIIFEKTHAALRH